MAGKRAFSANTKKNYSSLEYYFESFSGIQYAVDFTLKKDDKGDYFLFTSFIFFPSKKRAGNFFVKAPIYINSEKIRRLLKKKKDTKYEIMQKMKELLKYDLNRYISSMYSQLDQLKLANDKMYFTYLTAKVLETLDIDCICCKEINLVD